MVRARERFFDPAALNADTDAVVPDAPRARPRLRARRALPLARGPGVDLRARPGPRAADAAPGDALLTHGPEFRARRAGADDALVVLRTAGATYGACSAPIGPGPAPTTATRWPGGPPLADGAARARAAGHGARRRARPARRVRSASPPDAGPMTRAAGATPSTGSARARRAASRSCSAVDRTRARCPCVRTPWQPASSSKRPKPLHPGARTACGARSTRARREVALEGGRAGRRSMITSRTAPPRAPHELGRRRRRATSASNCRGACPSSR